MQRQFHFALNVDNETIIHVGEVKDPRPALIPVQSAAVDVPTPPSLKVKYYYNNVLQSEFNIGNSTLHLQQ